MLALSLTATAYRAGDPSFYTLLMINTVFLFVVTRYSWRKVVNNFDKIYPLEYFANQYGTGKYFAGFELQTQTDPESFKRRFTYDSIAEMNKIGSYLRNLIIMLGYFVTVSFAFKGDFSKFSMLMPAACVAAVSIFNFWGAYLFGCFLSFVVFAFFNQHIYPEGYIYTFAFIGLFFINIYFLNTWFWRKVGSNSAPISTGEVFNKILIPLCLFMFVFVVSDLVIGKTDSFLHRFAKIENFKAPFKSQDLRQGIELEKKREKLNTEKIPKTLPTAITEKMKQLQGINQKIENFDLKPSPTLGEAQDLVALQEDQEDVQHSLTQSLKEELSKKIYSQDEKEQMLNILDQFGENFILPTTHDIFNPPANLPSGSGPGLTGKPGGRVLNPDALMENEIQNQLAWEQGELFQEYMELEKRLTSQSKQQTSRSIEDLEKIQRELSPLSQVKSKQLVYQKQDLLKIIKKPADQEMEELKKLEQALNQNHEQEFSQLNQLKKQIVESDEIQLIPQYRKMKKNLLDKMANNAKADEINKSLQEFSRPENIDQKIIQSQLKSHAINKRREKLLNANKAPKSMVKKIKPKNLSELRHKHDVEKRTIQKPQDIQNTSNLKEVKQIINDPENFVDSGTRRRINRITDHLEDLKSTDLKSLPAEEQVNVKKRYLAEKQKLINELDRELIDSLKTRELNQQISTIQKQLRDTENLQERSILENQLFQFQHLKKESLLRNSKTKLALEKNSQRQDRIEKAKKEKRLKQENTQNIKQQIRKEQAKTRDQERWRKFVFYVLYVLTFIFVIYLLKLFFSRDKIIHIKEELTPEQKSELKKIMAATPQSFKNFIEEVDLKYKSFHSVINAMYYQAEYAPPALVIPVDEINIPHNGLRKLGYNLGIFFNAIHFSQREKFSSKEQRAFRRNFKRLQRYIAKL